jgi:hypothetical protein
VHVLTTQFDVLRIEIFPNMGNARGARHMIAGDRASSQASVIRLMVASCRAAIGSSTRRTAAGRQRTGRRNAP